MLSERLQKEKRLRDANVVTAELRLTELEKKNEIQLIEDYTDGDLQSAMNKITEAAVKYDRLMPGAVQLDAFECEYMPPNVFRLVLFCILLNFLFVLVSKLVVVMLFILFHKLYLKIVLTILTVQ